VPCCGAVKDSHTAKWRRLFRGIAILKISMAPPTWSRSQFIARGVAAGAAASWAPAYASTTTDSAELFSRFSDPSPRQWSASFTEALASSVNKQDNLVFPPWMEGTWALHSRPLATAAPLGRKFLPTDLVRMRLDSNIEEGSVAPLDYTVRFARRGSDGAVVSDRCANLRAVQNAAAGYARVEDVIFEQGSQLKVKYSPFGKDGAYPGQSRAEIYIQWRKQSAPRGEDEFAFAEATRSVLLAQQRSITLTDAETLCRFQRVSPTSVAARQRVLRFLTPNPNSAEGLLWQEAQGRAVAILDYELKLERIGDAPPIA
jgi:hypothetical protein